MKLLIKILIVFTYFSSNVLFAAEDPFKIGVLVCLTGDCAEWGSNSLKGIGLAVKEINAAGGILGREITTEVHDTVEGAGGIQAVTGFHNLIQKGDIHYFIGPSWTTGGLSMAPILSKRKDIIITSPSLGVAEFNEAAAHIFNIWPHDEYATKALARFAIEKGWRKAAIFSSQQPWESSQGNTFETEFKKLEGSISIKEEPVPSVTDLRTEALRILKSAPDVIFLSNFNQMGIAARQLRQIGYKGPLLAILMDDSRIEVAGGALDGAIFARYPDPSKSFIERFQAMFGKEPGITSDTAYDVVNLYALAIRTAMTFDVNQVKDTILGLKYEGASGSITFDSHGGVKKEPVLYVVNGKKMKVLEQTSL